MPVGLRALFELDALWSSSGMDILYEDEVPPVILSSGTFPL